jgi:hypothetical protein
MFTIRDMGRNAALVWPLILLLCGCNHGRNAIIVLDDQWAVKQAEADCQSRQQEGIPLCANDPVVAVRALEEQTTRAFQLNPACKGMTLLTLNSSENLSQVESRHTWWLFLELVRSNVPDGLRYTVARSHGPHKSGSASGQGQPDFIVREFCAFVQQGGTIE